MDYKVDFHTHTIFSDGGSTPEELIDDAVVGEVKALALTDHDNIEGIYEVSRLAKENNIDFLNGIEISALYKDGRIIHILGIGIDLDNAQFLKAYIEMKEARHESVSNILSIINKQGISIDIEQLKEKSFRKYLDRYDVYKYFIENKICETAQGIWDKYLDPIPYGEKELFKVEDAIRVIKEAGGISFLAHYNKHMGFAGLNNEKIEEEIRYLVSLGLDGVERYYPFHSEEDYKFLDYLINKYNLMISGGTDYHGKNRLDIKIGSGKDNNLIIPYEVYTNIIKILEQRKF
ncbi:PHP domain-containing protein [Clostridium fungisolvens]|uniref:Phosphoribosyl 1,2-cyclic phosphate 1,2-diphosphodiesterase n=1 Tax=Clostridium fungisolvens TaxID=1604897 RepID=A0A6V8SI28_9CLOT|nr:PHP domain-containing protein [Clostridium fungisolvens]GFP76165.1 Phosphoribosyl 1,2-cyclic phosphate 1,2-diphosphodiesterase [Clostridium fungisolvens]